jgi:site-specific DNA recombinase
VIQVKRRGKPQVATVRVAAYARISVADREASQFSSVQAQLEAIRSYVASQASQGWTLVGEQTDDGFSGATTDRPALQRLLEDVAERRVDAVVVHRFDRFSRCQRDFLNLLDVLERRGVAFVSVTQNLDTGTPMGRCMMSVITAFAQMEREVIAERTRDKIVASRRRGLWTGGRPPLGYDVVEKRLVVNEPEAERVRAIFQLYLARGSVLAVVDELRERGWTSKAWVGRQGQSLGGSPFQKESLRALLSNPVYIGQTRCGAETVEGAHDAIIDERTWFAVQARLGAKAPTGARYRRKRGKALLSGIARCVCGAALVRHESKKGSKRYSYYCCNKAQKHGVKACPGSRIAAGKLEAFVLDQLRAIGRDPKLLRATLQAEQRDREASHQTLGAEQRRLGIEREKLAAERRQVEAAAAEGGPGTDTLRERLVEIDDSLANAECRADQIAADLTALKVEAVDAGDLRRTLADLDPVWSELYPPERARLLGLLLDSVVLDAAKGDVAITFRPGGPQAVVA